MKWMFFVIHNKPLSSTPVYANAVTIGKSLRRRAGCQGNQPRDQRVEIRRLQVGEHRR